MRIALLPGWSKLALFFICNAIALNVCAMTSRHAGTIHRTTSMSIDHNVKPRPTTGLRVQKYKHHKRWWQWKGFLKKNASGRSQWVAFVLCLLLGVIGIHRFYLGYHLTGIIYFFTVGFFLIGWLVDLIFLLIPNMLPPKGHICY